ncbi:MAG: light-harvesting antenna LH1, beta subunit [Anaerolineae bacterium]
MSENVQTTTGPVYENDRVPDAWKNLFSNEEWLMHDIVVKATYGFLVIAIIAHTLVWLWQPWLVAAN